MSAPVAEVNFPPEWFGDEKWDLTELVQALTHEPTGTQCFIAGGVLTDGTNLLGLCWEGGGQHVARSGPATGWAIEERVDPSGPAFIRPMWAQVVTAMVAACRAAADELGEPSR